MYGSLKTQVNSLTVASIQNYASFPHNGAISPSVHLCPIPIDWPGQETLCKTKECSQDCKEKSAVQRTESGEKVPIMFSSAPRLAGRETGCDGRARDVAGCKAFCFTKKIIWFLPSSEKKFYNAIEWRTNRLPDVKRHVCPQQACAIRFLTLQFKTLRASHTRHPEVYGRCLSIRNTET